MELYNQIMDSKKFFLIAGPCVIEDESIMFNIAEHLVKETQKRDLLLIFKASYQKSNRTSIASYTGPGMDEGLRLLEKIKNQFNVPILTDVHETNEVAAVAEVADILQIPAFLSRQTYLIAEAARSGRIINIKKGQFMAPEDMLAQAQKVMANDNYQVMLTERGASFGYHNLVVDFRSFPIMKDMRFPVIYDVTHSMQRPSLNQTTGGTPEYAPMMARAAIATGMVDGLFIETHPHPMEALSDSATQLPLEDIDSVLDDCLTIWSAVEKYRSL